MLKSINAVLFLFFGFCTLAKSQINIGKLPTSESFFSFQNAELSRVAYDQEKTKEIWDFQVKITSANNKIEINENRSAELLGKLLLSINGQESYGLNSINSGLFTVSYTDQIEDQKLVFDCERPKIFRPSKFSKKRKTYTSKCIAELPDEMIFSNELDPSFLYRIVTDQNTTTSSKGPKLIAINGVKQEVLLIEVHKTISKELEFLKNDKWQLVDPKNYMSKIYGLEKLKIAEEHYYREGDKLPFAIAILDDDQVSLRYQSAKNAFLEYSSFAEKSIIIGPNPSFGELYFSIKGYEPGDYSIKIFNIIGNDIFSKQMSLGGEDSVLLDIGFLPKGSYLYSIYDDTGRNIQTKRLIKINP